MEYSHVNLRMRSQSQGGDFEFSAQLIFTKGFLTELSADAVPIAMQAMHLIHSRLVNSAIGADSLQRFYFQDVTFWVIDDIDHVTVLCLGNTEKFSNDAGGETFRLFFCPFS